MTSRKEDLLWFVSTTEDTNFLKEFSKSYDGNISVVHLNFITRFSLLGFKGKHYFPLLKLRDDSVNDNVTKTFNVLSGRLPEKLALLAFKSTYGLLKNIENSLSASVFVIPSGRHVHHVAATRFAVERDIKRIYINYSNFPGYTFFDPEGTDCLASIYRDPGRLDRMYPGEVDVEKIFHKFSELKKNQQSIPQASGSKIKTLLKSYAFVFDTLLQKAVGLVGDRRVAFNSKSLESDIGFEYDQALLGEQFVFFPMQVSTDQQVLVNYEGGSVIEALREALQIARDKGLNLYVREHPAEPNKAYIRSELDIIRHKNPDVKVVENSVSELIGAAAAVVTINSTVGLECRINNKPVVFLGKSFYAKANNRQLAKYLSEYLVPVDYHSAVLIPTLSESIISLSR